MIIANKKVFLYFVLFVSYSSLRNIMCLYVLISVLWCPLRFPHKYDVRLYLQLFVEELMSYVRYLCLFAYLGLQHILYCVLCFVCVSLNCPCLYCPFGYRPVLLDIFLQTRFGIDTKTYSMTLFQLFVNCCLCNIKCSSGH